MVSQRETCIASGDAADGLRQVLIARGTIQPEALRHPHRLDPQQFAAGCDGGGKCLVQRKIALQNKTKHHRGIDKGNQRRAPSSNKGSSDPPDTRGASRWKPKA